MKLNVVAINHAIARRTPHGVRGLKSDGVAVRDLDDLSHPSRGAWIEIVVNNGGALAMASHPSRGAWIEMAMPC